MTEESSPPLPIMVTELESCYSGSWSKVAHSLQDYGIALVDIGGIPDADSSAATASWFQTARVGFDRVREDPSRCRLIESSTSSAHAVGYHPAGGMSQRYNEFREGFVWSDGEHFEIKGLAEFTKCSQGLQDHLHGIASSAIQAVAAHIEVEQYWFEDHLGPTKTSSQWHTKRFVLPASATNTPDTSWLPTHTDPSLVSVVIHDLPRATPGGSGFEFYHDGVWHPIPVSGHSVAIIIVGSVLQHITNGIFKACRHRVQQMDITTQQRRMAATYFLRPAPSAILQSPPSISHPKVASTTFEQWLQKTARNYEKSQRKK